MTTKIVAANGTAGLSAHGKRMLADAMYSKGKAFIRAASLLSEQVKHDEPTLYVVLHNVCQGVEVVLKGILLAHDYDLYAPQLRKLGHNLVHVAQVVAVVRGETVDNEVLSQLKGLTNFYANHHLRYGGVADIFISPFGIKIVPVLLYILELTRACEAPGGVFEPQKQDIPAAAA